MIWKLPEGVKPSLLTAAKSLQRPMLESAFLTRMNETTYELVATNAFIMGRFDVTFEGERGPDKLVVPRDALVAIERRDARAFGIATEDDFIQPMSLETNERHGVLFRQGAMPTAGVPSWETLVATHEGTSPSNVYEFGVNSDYLHRIARGLGGVKRGVKVTPNTSPLRAIKVSPLQYPEREALIMPIRLNV